MEKSKKNNKRLGIVLVALMMIVAIGATAGYTLARYISTGEQSGQATVAKWGVTITATGSEDLFGDKYKSGSIVASDTDLSVDAAAEAVAPGTKGSVKFTINGEPEVKSELSLVFGDDFEVVYLQTADDEYYYPMKWFVNGTEVEVEGEDGEEASELAPTDYVAALKEAIIDAFFEEAFDGESTFDAGHNFSEDEEGTEVTISWEWDLFVEDDEQESEEDETINEYDTILGNLAADNEFYADDSGNPYDEDGEDGLAYSVDVNVSFTLTLKQIQ